MNIKNLSAILALVACPIALLASSSSDSKIEDAATASYNYRVVLAGHVTVKSDDGVVTLTGTVQDDHDRRLAADTVENLPGVVNVDNRITVEPTYAEHSDEWMAVKIRSRLLVKSNVSAADTKVAVNDGNVILTGTADNAAQKELTGAYARDIDGVRSVRNDIVVQDKSPGETVGETIDDASITTQVKFALLSHKGTSVFKTKVVTDTGIVTITGVAGSGAEKDLATKLAEDTRGVKSVVNDMTVTD